MGHFTKVIAGAVRKTGNSQVPYYKKMLPKSIQEFLGFYDVGIPGLRSTEPIQRGNREAYSPEALQFMCTLMDRMAQFPESKQLSSILNLRDEDRKFIDEQTTHYAALNVSKNIVYDSPEYKTVLGEINPNSATNRVPFGPYKNGDPRKSAGNTRIELPPHLKKFHLTIFGPATSQNMAYNALTSPERGKEKLPPKVLEFIQRADEGVGAADRPGERPVGDEWGRDSEDSVSRTKEVEDQSLINNLRIRDNTLVYTKKDKDGNVVEQLPLPEDKSRLAKPIQRIQGLAVPNANWQYNGEPVPMHVMDLALHIFHNRNNPESLTMYIPKIETEEEAAYFHNLISTAEQLIIDTVDSNYVKGSVKVICVLEDVRAVHRADEILDALGEYAAGFSLGWHDFLASGARLLRGDDKAEIPPKSDMEIVIKYVKASHDYIREVAERRGCLAIGGMYGNLPIRGNGPNGYDPNSWQQSLKGFFKDVVTQLKRGLDGFWVAHPDFMPYGKAIVQAYREDRENFSKLQELVDATITDPRDRQSLMTFFRKPDVASISAKVKAEAENETAEDMGDTSQELDTQFLRAITVMDTTSSDDRVDPSRLIQHTSHEAEVRFNVMQAFNYVLNYLHGNGCVALDSTLTDSDNNRVKVRAMDDLATIRRTAAEIWKYLKRNNISLESYIKIFMEIKKQYENVEIIVGGQPKKLWDAKWIEVASRVLLKVTTDENPDEFVIGLMYPFLAKKIHDDENSLALIDRLEPSHLALRNEVQELIRA